MPSLTREDHEAAKGWLAGLEAKARGAQSPAPMPVGTGYGIYDFGFDQFDGLAPTPADGPAYLNVAVAACLGWLDRNFPVADLRVVSRAAGAAGDPTAPEGHPLVALMGKPNPIDDFHSLFASCLLSDVVDGNTFLVKVRDNGGGIHSLWWVCPWDVTPVPNPSRDAARPVLRYDVRVGGSTTPYAPEDVVHIKDGKDPYYPYRGLAKLKAGLRSVSTIDRAELYTQTLMRNMGAVPYMLSPSDPGEQIDPSNVESLRGQYAERTTGFNNGKPLVSTQGLKADRLGLSPEEMALDTIREFPVAAICALIGTPAMAVGLPDPGKTYSNYAVAIRSAWDNGLIPRQARFAEAIDRQCPELVRPGQRVEWDYSRVKALQADWAETVAGIVKAVGGPIMTQNEGRARVHMPPVAGGDEIRRQAAPGYGAAEKPGGPASPTGEE